MESFKVLPLNRAGALVCALEEKFRQQKRKRKYETGE
jgi:hypothetical protein